MSTGTEPRDEKTQRFAELLTGQLGHEIDVWWSDQGLVISWTDGPPEGDVTATAAEAGFDASRATFWRTFTPWAWVWVIRERLYQDGSLPEDPAAAVAQAETDLAGHWVAAPSTDAEHAFTTQDPQQYPPYGVAQALIAMQAERATKPRNENEPATPPEPAGPVTEPRDEMSRDAAGDGPAGETKQRNEKTPSGAEDRAAGETKLRDENRPPAKRRRVTKPRDEMARPDPQGDPARVTKRRDEMCHHCGGPIPPSARPQGRRALWCSPRCKSAAHRARAAASTSATAAEVRRCHWCRDPLPVSETGRRGVYCSGRCKSAAHRARHSAGRA